MATIRSNKIMNKIGSAENVRNYNSNLKNFWTPYLEKQIRAQREFNIINDNISFCYSGEDFIDRAENSDYNKILLDGRGYDRIKEDEYSHTDYNSLHEIEFGAKGFNINRGNDTIEYFDGAYEHKLNFLFEDNLIIFYDKKRREIVFELSFERGVEINDMVIFDGFIHFYLKYNEDYYVVLTHFGLEFANVETKFADIKSFYKVRLSHNNFGKIVAYDCNNYYFIDPDMNTIKVTLGRLYQFISDGKLFFTHSDKFNELKFISLEENIQVEHLFLYDLVGLFGLNDLVDPDGQKIINSKNFKNRSDLFKFRFDDTINGYVNFFDYDTPQKTYKIDFNDGKFIKVYGNLFFDGFKTGAYKLVIDTKDIKRPFINNLSVVRCRLMFFKNNEWVMVKDVTTSFSGNKLYFSNLCIEINGSYENPFTYELEFDITDNFPVSLLIKDYNLDSAYDDNPSNYEFLLQSNKIVEIPSRLKNPMKIDYMDGKMVIGDFYIYTSDGKFTKTQAHANVISSNDFNAYPDNSDYNYYVNYDNSFDEDIEVISKVIRNDIFNINRLHFSLSINA